MNAQLLRWMCRIVKFASISDPLALRTVGVNVIQREGGSDLKAVGTSIYAKRGDTLC
jgi:hypothetical protein